MSLSLDLRHVVDIQQLTVTQDSNGDNEEAWTVLHENVWCAIKPLSVNEFIRSQSMHSGLTLRLVIRRLSGLNATMRIVGKCGCHVGKIYNPQGWLEDPKSGIEWLNAPCSEGINNG
jgi:SPP1 family predicted phage head-tail adaptor